MSTSASVDFLNPALSERAREFEVALADGLARLTELDKWMIVVGVSIASGLELGATIAVNIILVDMKGNVAASQDQISWVLIVYLAAFLAVLPLSERLASRFGHRNHLVGSLLLYAAGALGCFLSGTLGELLAARAVMGAGGGAFLVRTLVTLFRLHEGRRRLPSLVTLATVFGSSRALVPLIFAVVTDSGRWNLAFLIVVPVALLAAAILYLFVPAHLELAPEPPPTDFLSTALAIVGLVAFQIAISRGEQDMWLQSNLIRWMFAVCVVCLGVLVWWDTRLDNSNPVLNLRLLLGEPMLTSGAGLALIVGGFLAAGLYVLPQYLRGVQNYSATQTSLFFCVDASTFFIGMVCAGFALPKLNLRLIVLVGLTIAACANLLFVYELTPDTPGFVLSGILLLHGFSLGILLPGTTNLLLGRTRFRFIDFGMTIYFFFRQLGAAVGLAGAVALIDIRETLHSSRLLDTANRLSPAVDNLVGHLTLLLHSRNLPSNVAAAGAYQLFRGSVVQQTTLLAFADLFWCFALVAVAGILLVLMLMWRDRVARRALSRPGIPKNLNQASFAGPSTPGPFRVRGFASKSLRDSLRSKIAIPVKLSLDRKCRRQAMQKGLRATQHPR
jgi:MFS transporter, DHA2 family, multidrug resistance protein